MAPGRAAGGPRRAGRLTSRCEPAVDLAVDFPVPHIASDLLYGLPDDSDGQHEALQRERREGEPC